MVNVQNADVAKTRVEVARLVKEIDILRTFLNQIRAGDFTDMPNCFFAATEAEKEADRIRTLPDDEVLPCVTG